jgi:hypothetical protein
MKEKKRTIRGLSPANSAAATPGPWTPVLPLRRRKGPAPGTVDRYGASDRALYPKLKRLMRKQSMSATAAARQLADDGKVAGVGSPESRARRLATRYLADS